MKGVYCYKTENAKHQKFCTHECNFNANPQTLPLTLLQMPMYETLQVNMEQNKLLHEEVLKQIIPKPKPENLTHAGTVV